MDVGLFDFDLPEERIALRPAEPRDSARLLVVHEDGQLTHARVSDLPEFLKSGDGLVVNDTKVINARLRGLRQRAGGPDGPLEAKIEILIYRRTGPASFEGFARPARKLMTGDALHLGAHLQARVDSRGEAGEVAITFSLSGAELDAAIAAEGETPLPPYIAGKRPADARDLADYQTVFAREAGSVAAPTAGLHFTPALLDRLAAAGISRETVTLHVGPGTFLPVSVEDTAAHKMHAEMALVTPETAARLNGLRVAGGRIVAVGTTSLRTLESAAGEDGAVRPFSEETGIFITPGYRFRTAEVLLTNFHLPRSTLFMLVSAFSGLEVMRHAYAEAIRLGYRFYSYGDACLLFRRL
ncbi:S-adenosylmethionine:tRNA ribosyltransferase-isomerase [Rhizomicrobium palustre]|uniref:S-adenosylmethionine:tRNA ribosyltransferase-isomerase n=1 Tax=Rhizomicrobium palustre TaxID=189966 RepID=A0A846MUM0_9PROT|nr:tRNA preQ1(34) S-adenosylmethionine ribosyltransferase-isomerase QueA [Rhizomicrobium palustre]NIK86929.1 S-adenosylmethionine:tRNA ribosyltransferase-isomerase [Rhizomicrobium palustre]